MELIPWQLGITISFMLGCIIGSFLDVVTSRFHTGKSINGRSRCMSCGHTLSWYELVPLLSYVMLKGRCHNCSGKIPLRLLIMELVTGGLFAYVYLHSLSLPDLFFGWVLVSMLLVIAVYDINHMVIPHAFVFAMLALSVAGVVAQTPLFDVTAFVLHIATGMGVSLFFASLWVLSKGKWIGLGDAKLAFPLGLLLLPLAGFSLIVLSFWVGALVSLLLLGIQKILISGKRHLRLRSVPLTMKSEVPFAPFLIIAFLLVYFENVDVLSLMARLF